MSFIHEVEYLIIVFIYIDITKYISLLPYDFHIQKNTKKREIAEKFQTHPYVGTYTL